MTKLFTITALTALSLIFAACGPEIDDGDVGDAMMEILDDDAIDQIAAADEDEDEDDDDFEIRAPGIDAADGSPVADLDLAHDEEPCDTWGPGDGDLDIDGGADGQAALADADLPLAVPEDDSEDTSGHDDDLDLVDGFEPAPSDTGLWFADAPDDEGESDSDGDDDTLDHLAHG